MQISFQKTDNILIASACGELDHHSAAAVREGIDKTMERFRCKHLILDFENVTFMDSSGIGVVLGRYKKVKNGDGILYLAGCSDYVKKILSMAGLFTIITHQETVADATNILKQQEQLQTEVNRNVQ